MPEAVIGTIVSGVACGPVRTQMLAAERCTGQSLALSPVKFQARR
jgi:hypothetical protein